MISSSVLAAPAVMQTQPARRFPLIDGYAFAAARGEHHGACAVSAFGRLQDLLHSPEGELEYSVRGSADEFGRPALRVQVKGVLRLACQRCLGALAFPLGVDSTLVLARSEAEIEAQPVEPDGPDRIVGSRDMALGALLEDEILLAIPFAPRHEQCSGAEDRKGEGRTSPFTGLRGLLKKGGRAGN
jgi:uncharacterized protein